MVQGVFPAARLKPAEGGLLSVADVVRHSTNSGEWLSGGFGWDTMSCPVEVMLADYCTNAAEGIIAASEGQEGVEAWPFGIVTRYKCSSIGYSLEERRQIALAQAEAATGKAVERALWSGEIDIASNRVSARYLTSELSVDVTPSGGVAVPVALGVAALEQALADCGAGAQGVIHMSRSAALIGSGQQVIQHALPLTTGLFTPVAAGAGYDPRVSRRTVIATQAAVPAPEDPGALETDQWIYATGPVAVHLGQIEVLDTVFDRAENIVTVLTARPAAVYWDSCCQFAAHVDLTLAAS